MSKRNRNPTIPPSKPERAKANIEAQAAAAKRARAEACLAEITAALKRHNCSLGFSQEWVNGQPGASIQIRINALDAPA